MPPSEVDVLDDLVLGVGQHALQTAEDGERQDVVAVVLLVDDVAQVLVRRVPDDAGCRRVRSRRCRFCHARSFLGRAESVVSGTLHARRVLSRLDTKIHVDGTSLRGQP